VRKLDQDKSTAGTDARYRAFLMQAQVDQKIPFKKENSATAALSPSAVTSSLSITEEAVLEAPEFKAPVMDPVAWELSAASLDRLSLIQNAISTGVDKIQRLLAVVKASTSSPTKDADLSEVLKDRLGGVTPTGLADEFFARFSPKVVLATLLQAYAHTKNSDRRSVENLMTPFEHEVTLDSEGKAIVTDRAEDEAIQFLYSLYQAKMTLMVNEIVAQVEGAYLESKKNLAASTFVNTADLDVAAGVLIEARTRGGAGGRLITLCARTKMVLPRVKIQMMLKGMYNGVRLFTDHHSGKASLSPPSLSIFLLLSLIASVLLTHVFFWLPLL